MKTIDEMIAVMTAYNEGKQIELRSLDDEEDIWGYIEDPVWDWRDYDYRIKPEKPKLTYRPYDSEEELDEAIKEHGIWLRKKDVTSRILIIGYNCAGVYVILNGGKYSPFNAMFEFYEWADGTPFGRRVEL